jgi:hypothetical protein
MIKVLKDESGFVYHDDFQKWRRANKQSAVLHFKKSRSTLIHGTQCRHFGTMRWTVKESHRSLTRKAKVVGTSESELIAWARDEGIAVKACSDCLRTSKKGIGVGMRQMCGM